MESDQFFEQYLELRKKIENQSVSLSNQHAKHMQCKKGCDMCCMDNSIFPIEFHHILKNLIAKGFSGKDLVTSNDGTCIFLQDHACRIYNERPIICRTHGLPLLYANDDGEWELSACELNFTEFEFSEFTPDNTYPQDKFNSKLFMLNKSFIGELKTEKYNETDLLPLKKLFELL